MDSVLEWLTGISGWVHEGAGRGPELALGAMAVLLLVGLTLLVIGWRRSARDKDRPTHLADLGIGLIVGGLFALASYANQVTVEISNFRSSLAQSQDLTGFVSNGRDLRGLNFSGKDLHAAGLNGEDLTGAKFKYAELQEAQLRNAILKKANFFYATFLRADLIDADFREANLYGAKITTQSLADEAGERAAILERAKVNANTCWNITFLDPATVVVDDAGQGILDVVLSAQLTPEDGRTLGRACYRREVGSSLQSKVPAAKEPIYVCVDFPHLTRDPCS
jgi:hypothetical protein